jgi:hypothetical protein
MKISIGVGTIIITALLCILKGAGLINIPWLWCFGLFWLPIVLGIRLYILSIILIIVVIIGTSLIDFISNS